MHTPTILVYESDPTIRELFNEVLSTEGYRVRLVEHDELCPGRLLASPPDLMLLDLTPVTILNTIALLEQLQRRPATAQLPVLVSTTNPQYLERFDKTLHRPGCAVLVKPFELDHLLLMVHQHLALHV